MLEVKISEFGISFDYKVWIFERHERKVSILQADGTFIEQDEKEDAEPTFILPFLVAKPLLESLSKIGIKTDSDAKVEGKLKATEYHLEDLRKLLQLS